MTSAIYSDLRTDVPEFRILTLEPAVDHDDLIVCRLKIHAISEAPEYQAISYVWGDQTDRFTIVVNNELFLVTKNLFDVLRRLRRKTSSIFLWADAICINQLDVSERNHQVQLMREVYSCAEFVVAWIGEAEEDSDLAMDLIQNWASKSARKSPLIMKKLLKEIPNALDERAWQALRLLFDRPYWTRMWVLQEIVFSKAAILMCGSNIISWCDIGLALTIWSELPKPQNSYLIGVKITVLYSNSNYYKAIPLVMTLAKRTAPVVKRGVQPTRNAVILLESALRLKATDPRDKVYGLLGFPEMAKLGIVPNYDQTVQNVYADFARSYIRNERRLDILCEAGIQSAATNSSQDLPSWIPDLRHSLRFIPYSKDIQLNFSAADGMDAEIPDLSDDSTTINTLGVIFDVVEQFEDLVDRRKLFEPCWRLALSQRSHYPTGITQFQAFFRTIILDCSDEGFGPTHFRDEDSHTEFFDLAAGMMYLLGISVRRREDSLAEQSKLESDEGIEENTCLNEHSEMNIYQKFDRYSGEKAGEQSGETSTFNDESTLEPRMKPGVDYNGESEKSHESEPEDISDQELERDVHLNGGLSLRLDAEPHENPAEMHEGESDEASEEGANEYASKRTSDKSDGESYYESEYYNKEDYVLSFEEWRAASGYNCSSNSREDILEMFLGETGKDSTLKWPTVASSKRGRNSLFMLLPRLNTCEGKRFFTSEKGYMAMAMKSVESGDLVCVIPGCSTPLILRRNQDHYNLIGQCYMYGIMHGEVMKEVRSGNLKFEDILIR